MVPPKHHLSISSIDDFSDPIKTVQTIRNLNLLQANTILSIVAGILMMEIGCTVPFGITNAE